MARSPIEIDRDKLRAAIRKLGDEYVFYMLDDAIDLLPPTKLHKLVKKYIDPRRLRPDGETATRSDLLSDVRAFEKASLVGEYYESFNANSGRVGRGNRPPGPLDHLQGAPHRSL